MAEPVLPLTREQLAEFLPNLRAIKAFELALRAISVTIPAEIEELKAQVSTSNSAMDGIDGEDGMPLPGKQGIQGIQGQVGAGGAVANYAHFVSTVNQPNPVGGADNAAQYDVNVGSSGITLANGSEFTVSEAGTYNLDRKSVV